MSQQSAMSNVQDMLLILWGWCLSACWSITSVHNPLLLGFTVDNFACICAGYKAKQNATASLAVEASGSPELAEAARSAARQRKCSRCQHAGGLLFAPCSTSMMMIACHVLDKSNVIQVEPTL